MQAAGLGISSSPEPNKPNPAPKPNNPSPAPGFSRVRPCAAAPERGAAHGWTGSARSRAGSWGFKVCALGFTPSGMRALAFTPSGVCVLLGQNAGEHLGWEGFCRCSEPGALKWHHSTRGVIPKSRAVLESLPLHGQHWEAVRAHLFFTRERLFVA